MVHLISFCSAEAGIVLLSFILRYFDSLNIMLQNLLRDVMEQEPRTYYEH